MIANGTVRYFSGSKKSPITNTPGNVNTPSYINTPGYERTGSGAWNNGILQVAIQG